MLFHIRKEHLRREDPMHHFRKNVAEMRILRSDICPLAPKISMELRMFVKAIEGSIISLVTEVRELLVEQYRAPEKALSQGMPEGLNVCAFEDAMVDWAVHQHLLLAGGLLFCLTFA